ELICVMCAQSTHACHYNYKEFYSMDDQLDAEVKENAELIAFLLDERGRMALRKKQLERSLNEANNEI
ncbi:hypothetical protein PFISCL1PPCAC_21561, partial [Pristionchus fissidentatus]